ncbi:MAG TPA: hypothetical protein VN428_23835 [Bryobacteraceae bacterium]|nr:hypothetical protein [Bryobacteraceae bacterium]
MISLRDYDRTVHEIFDFVDRVVKTMQDSGADYRIVGGISVFLHIAQVDPTHARLSRDIDIAVKRGDLPSIQAAAERNGFEYKQEPKHGQDTFTLIDRQNGKPRADVHLIMAGEKAREDHPEPVPPIGEICLTADGVKIAPLFDVVHMMLSSYRLKDRVHVQDMDSSGLINGEVESRLSRVLRDRLAEIRRAE